MTDEKGTPQGPERNHGLIWFLAILALLMLAFALFRISAARTLAAQLAEIRASGYPVTGVELDRWYVSTAPPR